MSDIKNKYGASNQAITITITSLGSNSTRESTVIDNSSDLFLNVLVNVKIKTNSSGTVSTGYVNVYAYGTADGGTTYNGGATGSDASITLSNPPNMRLIGVINAVANSTTYNGLFDVAAAFDGVMPQKWGIVVDNRSGAALDASVGSAWYQGILNQVV
jgi:hypothetical protein